MTVNEIYDLLYADIPKLTKIGNLPKAILREVANNLAQYPDLDKETILKLGHANYQTCMTLLHSVVRGVSENPNSNKILLTYQGKEFVISRASQDLDDQ